MQNIYDMCKSKNICERHDYVQQKPDSDLADTNEQVEKDMVSMHKIQRKLTIHNYAKDG